MSRTIFCVYRDGDVNAGAFTTVRTGGPRMDRDVDIIPWT